MKPKKQFSLENSENFYISKDKDLVLEYGLYGELKDEYSSLLNFIIESITD
jgi:hypothetical protein